MVWTAHCGVFFSHVRQTSLEHTRRLAKITLVNQLKVDIDEVGVFRFPLSLLFGAANYSFQLA